MEDLLELEDNGYGVEDQTSDSGELDATTTAPSSGRQPQKINLDDLEDFRKFKSEAQKRESRLDNAYRQTQRELEQMRAWRRQVELEGLDEVGRIKYERDEAYRLLQEREQEQNRLYQEFQWNSLVDEVARETGIPRVQLEDAKDSNDLWRLGRKYEKENGARRSRHDDDDEDVQVNPRRVDDRVALGGGKALSQEARIREEYRKARSENNWAGMNAAKDKAYRAGIDPDSLRK